MNNKTNVLLFLLFHLFYISGCDLFDFSDISILMYPTEDISVIDMGDEVWIEFGSDIIHEEAEQITSVNTFEGSVQCDIYWTENRLTLAPIKGWSPGVLYSFICKGRIKTTDDRRYNIDEIITFYAGSSSLHAILMTQYPENDEVVDNETAVELQFSKPISDNFIKEYITLLPSSDYSVQLDDGNFTAIISPEGNWKGKTRYEWRISNELEDTEGITVFESYKGYFRTESDTTAPEGPLLSAADISDVSMELPLDNLDNSMGLLIEFSEDIEIEAITDKISFTPSFTISSRIIDNRHILVFPMDNKWIPEQDYELTIKEGIADISGNITEQDFIYNFTSAIPPLNIVSITNTPVTPQEIFTTTDFSSGDSLQIGILADTEHSFEIEFSLAFSEEEAERLIANISLESIFPFYITNPTMYSTIKPVSPGTTIILNYNGFSLKSSTGYGIPEEKYFYELRINGGSQGFILDNGSYLLEDFILSLETIDS